MTPRSLAARMILAAFLTAVPASPVLADVDLTGDYRVDETAFGLADACTANIVQTGTSLNLTASCIGGNYLSANGTIDATSGDFTLSGTCDVSAPPPGPAEALLVSGSGSLDSLTFAMDGNCGNMPVAFFGTKCGNGNLDANEGCEDGNRDDGDCCSSSCAAETGNVCNAATPACTVALCDSSGTCVPDAADEPAGTPCDLDADLCTEDLCDGAGTCETTGQAVTCDICESCDSQTGCIATPSEIAPHGLPGQCTPAYKDTAKLLNHLDNDDRDRLVWKWNKGFAVPAADFGNPVLSTGYTLCLFAGTTGGYAVVGGLEIPPGSGWKSAPGGFRFKGDLAGGGKAKIDLRGSAVDLKSKIKVTVKGPALGYPGGIEASLSGAARSGQIELRADNGKCWASNMGIDKHSRTNAVMEKLKLRDCYPKLSKCR